MKMKKALKNKLNVYRFLWSKKNAWHLAGGVIPTALLKEALKQRGSSYASRKAADFMDPVCAGDAKTSRHRDAEL
jgi:hypothetical protein